MKLIVPILLTCALIVCDAPSMRSTPRTQGRVALAAGDTDVPYPIDVGGGAGAPSTYKGLALGLHDNGSPQVDPVDGLVGVVCIGMSNGHQECRDFATRLAAGEFAGVDPRVRVVNCAVGSHAIERWNDPAYDALLWDACIDLNLPSAGLRANQVRVVWHKAASQDTADASGRVLPPYPDPAADYFRFQDSLGVFAARLATKLPSVQAVYTSSRSYGGFASRPQRGEPLSFEEGLALNRWLGDHPSVAGMWHGWGPYVWAPQCGSGLHNGSGVCYDRSDYVADGVHPSATGREKVSRMLDRRFREHGWYASPRLYLPLLVAPSALAEAG